MSCRRANWLCRAPLVTKRPGGGAKPPIGQSAVTRTTFVVYNRLNNCAASTSWRTGFKWRLLRRQRRQRSGSARVRRPPLAFFPPPPPAQERTELSRTFGRDSREIALEFIGSFPSCSRRRQRRRRLMAHTLRTRIPQRPLFALTSRRSLLLTWPRRPLEARRQSKLTCDFVRAAFARLDC